MFVNWTTSIGRLLCDADVMLVLQARVLLNVVLQPGFGIAGGDWPTLSNMRTTPSRLANCRNYVMRPLLPTEGDSGEPLAVSVYKPSPNRICALMMSRLWYYLANVDVGQLHNIRIIVQPLAIFQTPILCRCGRLNATVVKQNFVHPP